VLAADVVFLILPFVVIGLVGSGLFVVFRERAAAIRTGRRLVEPDLAAPVRDPRPDVHPWWASTWLWLAIGLISIVLGLFVWPGLFGGTVFFLPLVWVRRPRRGGRMDPRTNGHAKHGTID
jgi:hypothetical protein